MEIRVTIHDGHARVETISLLEDLWHDFEFFKGEATRYDQPGASVNDKLTAKRHQRAALLVLVFYFEGVLNQWLQTLLPKGEFETLERKPMDLKVKRISKLTHVAVQSGFDVSEAKMIRNALVHLRPGRDLELLDKINADVLASTEQAMVAWLQTIEQALGLTRHPNTDTESRDLRDALGPSDQGRTGYTGRTENMSRRG